MCSAQQWTKNRVRSEMDQTQRTCAYRHIVHQQHQQHRGLSAATMRPPKVSPLGGFVVCAYFQLPISRLRPSRFGFSFRTKLPAPTPHTQYPILHNSSTRENGHTQPAPAVNDEAKTIAPRMYTYRLCTFCLEAQLFSGWLFVCPGLDG